MKGVRPVDYGRGFVVSSYNAIPILAEHIDLDEIKRIEGAEELDRTQSEPEKVMAKCCDCHTEHRRMDMRQIDKDYMSGRIGYNVYEAKNGRYRCNKCQKERHERYRIGLREDMKGISGKELINRVIQLEKDDMLDMGHNIMGCDEAYYDPRYLIYRAFKDGRKLGALRKMSVEEVKPLLIVAKKASEVFY